MKKKENRNKKIPVSHSHQPTWDFQQQQFEYENEAFPVEFIYKEIIK